MRQVLLSSWILFVMVLFLAIAVALKQCLTEEFVQYSKQILANATALANRLKEHGFTLVTGIILL